MTLRVSPLAAAALTGGLLTIVKVKAPFQMLLADRFFPASGWVEIAALTVYAALLVRYLLRSGNTAGTRMTIWFTFSILFFSEEESSVASAER